MTQDIFIGLTGRKNSGKDTAGNLLANEFYATHTPIRISFADSIKDEVCKLLNADYKELERNKNHPTVRHLLQFHGTDFARKTHGEDYWIKRVEDKVVACQATRKSEKPFLFYFTDCRFVNEADYIRSKGGCIVKVEREGIKPVDNHLSETELETIRPDFHILNHIGITGLALEIKAVTMPKLLGWIKQHQEKKAA